VAPEWGWGRKTGFVEVLGSRMRPGSFSGIPQELAGATTLRAVSLCSDSRIEEPREKRAQEGGHPTSRTKVAGDELNNGRVLFTSGFQVEVSATGIGEGNFKEVFLAATRQNGTSRAQRGLCPTPSLLWARAARVGECSPRAMLVVVAQGR
jgi:hypothetical protein